MCKISGPQLGRFTFLPAVGAFFFSYPGRGWLHQAWRVPSWGQWKSGSHMDHSEWLESPIDTQGWLTGSVAVWCCYLGGHTSPGSFWPGCLCFCVTGCLGRWLSCVPAALLSHRGGCLETEPEERRVVFSYECSGPEGLLEMLSHLLIPHTHERNRSQTDLSNTI